MDDLFGDLIPAKKPSNVGSEFGSASLHAVERGQSMPRGPRSTPRPSVPDLFSEQTEACPKAESASNGKPAAEAVMSKEALQQLMTETVQSAVDATFGKFARSLRTVLEDMTKRIEANTIQYSELKDSLCDLSDLLDGQAVNVNSRFTSLDLALREVDRGVQAMRDKQELHEAQALLAKYSEPEKKAVAESKPADQPPAITPAPTPTPKPEPLETQALSVAPTAPAPALVAAIAAPPAMPSPVPTPAPVAASAPSVQQIQQQPGYQQQPMPQPGYQQLQQQQQQQQPVPRQPMMQAQLSMPQEYAAPPPGSHPQHSHYGPYQPPPALQPADSGLYQQNAMPAVQQKPQPGPPLQYSAPRPMPQQQQQQPQGAPQYGGPQYGQQPQAHGRPAMQGPPPSSHMPAGMPPPQSYPTSSMPSYPAPLSVPLSMSYRSNSGGLPQSGPPSSQQSPRGGPPKGPTTTVVPIEQVVTDITQMGFERHQVMTIINNLERSGQAVDLNVILDRLTRGDYR